MDRVERCLAQIGAIKDVAAGDAVPYVARSRMGRLTLSIASLVAEEAGLAVPDLPGPIHLPDKASEDLLEIAERCNRLLELARHISQPSEPLAERWTRGWRELLEEVGSIEERLLLTPEQSVSLRMPDTSPNPFDGPSPPALSSRPSTVRAQRCLTGC